MIHSRSHVLSDGLFSQEKLLLQRLQSKGHMDTQGFASHIDDQAFSEKAFQGILELFLYIYIYIYIVILLDFQGFEQRSFLR